MFKDVRELPPAHSAIIQDGHIKLKRYWRLAYPREAEQRAPVDPLREKDAERTLFHLLEDATRLRLRGDVPVGAYVSGGLDSAVTAAMMRKLTAAAFNTFSIRFDDSEVDEGGYQQCVIGRLGTVHHELHCTSADIARDVARAVWHLEQPIVRLAPVPLLRLSQLANRAGCKVVMTGEGADEILGGYDLYKECKIRRFWLRRPESRIRPLLLRRLYPYLSTLGRQSDSYLRAFFHANGGENTTSPFFSHLPRWSLAARVKAFFSDELRYELRSRDAVTDLERLLPQEFAGWDWMSRAQYLETAFFLPGFILSSQGDRVAMANAVEGRFPFLDPRVVEFSNRLPTALKMKVLCEKYLLKRSTAGLAPPRLSRARSSLIVLPTLHES